MEQKIKEIVTFTVDAADSGMRLDVYLALNSKNIPSRTLAARLVTQGDVLVNGKKSKPALKLEACDRIEANLAILTQHNPHEPQGEKLPLDVIFEDEHILVINKPAGLTVHPGAGNRTGTLVNALLAHCGHSIPSLGGPERAGIVHRLDKDTSGVMVTAKSLAALSGLARQFAQHKQERYYLCLARGTPQKSHGEIETWHGRDSKNRLKFAVQQTGVGKIAKLQFEVLESFLNGDCSLVKCKLHTGRTHQIRVQMEHIGHPLLGDPIYRNGPPYLLRIKDLASKLKSQCTRQMLHAQSLRIQHPISKEMLDFNTQPPEDFQIVMQTIKSHRTIS